MSKCTLTFKKSLLIKHIDNLGKMFKISGKKLVHDIPTSGACMANVNISWNCWDNWPQANTVMKHCSCTRSSFMHSPTLPPQTHPAFLTASPCEPGHPDRLTDPVPKDFSPSPPFCLRHTNWYAHSHAHTENYSCLSTLMPAVPALEFCSLSVCLPPFISGAITGFPKNLPASVVLIS